MFDPLRSTDPKWITLALAGAAGGVLRWITLRTHWRDGLIAIAAGTICSYYFAEILAPVLVILVHAVPLFITVPVSDSQMIGPAGLLSGITGISITGFLIDWMGILSRTFLKKQRDGK